MLRPNLNDAMRAAPRVHRLPAMLLALTLAAFHAAAPAADADIEVVTVKGDVRVTAGGRESPAKAGSTLGLPSTVQTGRDGSTDLRQGDTRIGVAPNTRLDFPSSAATGAPADRIVQPLGSAFYDVGPRGNRRLRVETPYLVAVIKGTQFTVAVEPDKSTISLHEGSLEILAPDTGASVMLNAGEIAVRQRGDEAIRVVPMREGAAASAGVNGTVSKDADETAVLSAGGKVSGDSGPVKTIDPADGKVALDADATLDAGGLVNAKTGVEADVDLGPDRIDAGVTTEVDVGVVGVEAGVDAGVDLGAGIIDAGVDAGVDLGTGPLDAGVDAGIDAGIDLGAGAVDAGVDLGVDTGLVDADVGVDASVDASAGTVDLGVDVLDTGIDVGLGGDSLIDVGVSTTPDAGDSGGLLDGILRRIGL